MGQQGRPSVRDRIINNVISPAILTERHYLPHDVHYTTIDTNRTTDCLAECGLIKNNEVRCNNNMGLVQHSKPSDGKAWCCRQCKKY